MLAESVHGEARGGLGRLRLDETRAREAHADERLPRRGALRGVEIGGGPLDGEGGGRATPLLNPPLSFLARRDERVRRSS